MQRNRTSEVDVSEASSLVQRRLDAVLAIDALRDRMDDGNTFLRELTGLLRRHLSADFAVIAPRDAGETVPGTSSSLGVITVRTEALVPLHERAQCGTEPIECAPEDVARLVSPDCTFAHALAVPIKLGKQDLGIMVAARSGSRFSKADRDVLQTASTQVDSALRQLKEMQALRQRAKIIQAVYRIDRIRDLNLPFDRMVGEILREICKAMDARAGALLLQPSGSPSVEIRAVTHRALAEDPDRRQPIETCAATSLHNGRIEMSHSKTGPVRAIVCAPLRIGQRAIGAVCVINRRDDRPFESWQKALMHGIVSQVDTAVFEASERVRLVELLARSVGPSLVDRLITAENSDLINCQRRVLSVLYADIRGSTELAESTDIDLLLGFTNDYLDGMTQVILQQEGMVDKFVGDEVMAVFGAPFEQPDHAARAVRTARDMQKKHAGIMAKWQGQGVRARPIGIGIATGEMLVGELGGRARSDYTVLGRPANLGARLCSMAAGGDIYLCEETYRLAGAPVPSEPVADVTLKGISRPITAYRLTPDH